MLTMLTAILKELAMIFDRHALGILTMAMEEPGGITLDFTTRKRVMGVRQQLYQCRDLDRERRLGSQARLPGWGDSPFDVLTFRVRNPAPGRCVLHIYRKWKLPTLPELDSQYPKTPI